VWTDPGLVVAGWGRGNILTEFSNTGIDSLELAANSGLCISSLTVLIMEVLDLQAKAAMLVS
jgi:hypothetical protein